MTVTSVDLQNKIQEFFKSFNIEPIYVCGEERIYEAMLEYECTDGDRSKCKSCKHVHSIYPEISSKIFMELLCILNEYNSEEYQSCSLICGTTKEKLINSLLEDFIQISHEDEPNDNFNKLNKRIQDLFSVKEPIKYRWN